MAVRRYQFDRFSLDPIERRLFAGDVLVELNNRYFDALVLLLQHPGTLLSKERFLQEGWQGIPVTDEVLTPCIRLCAGNSRASSSSRTCTQSGLTSLSIISLTTVCWRTSRDSQNQPTRSYGSSGSAPRAFNDIRGR